MLLGLVGSFARYIAVHCGITLASMCVVMTFYVDMCVLMYINCVLSYFQARTAIR